VIVTGDGAGGGEEGGDGLAGVEDELPEGGSLELCAVVAELPPQPASAQAIIAISASHIVVVFHCVIVLAPVRCRLAAVTDWDKH
jgi:hypothetical protein